MPTKSLLRHIEVQKFETVEEEEACLEKCRILCNCLYHRIGNFDANYGDMSVEDKLDFMESYVSHRCLSRAAKWCSSVTVVMLTVTLGVSIQGWSSCCGIRIPYMTLPDVERAEQLKAKETKKLSNPFATVAKTNKKEKIDQPLAKANPTVMWNPVIPGYSVPLTDNGVSMAAKSRSMVHAEHQARLHLS